MAEGAAGPVSPSVTLFVHDLAGNPVARAAPLAAALARAHRVEVLGLLLSGDEVYAPYRGRFAVRALRSGGSTASILAAGRGLARMAGGDVLYACKPLLSTLVPALLAARRGARVVLLDVEDDEWESRAVEGAPTSLRGVLRRLADTHRWMARAVHPLTRWADGVTVSSRALQRRYGGTLIRHGPDETEFDPHRPDLADRAALRASFGLPQGRRLAVFAGRPRPHKGLDVLVAALARPEAAAWDLVVAGAQGNELVSARAVLGPRLHDLGQLPNARMAALLAACDAVPVPQRDVPFARAQLPAKAIEAMAMAIPVVSTPVADLAEILGEGARGWLVPPGDAGALAAALAEIAAAPDAAARKGAEGRRWFLAEASVGVAAERLERVIADATERRRAR